MSVMFVVFAIGLPLFTSTTSLLFHATSNSMKVLMATVFFRSASVFLVTFSCIFRLALLTPDSQPVREGAILAELAFVFQSFTFAASLHFSIHCF